MSYQTIATDIKAKLTALGGCGVIHTYARQAVDAAKFIELFRDKVSGQILGCEITRGSVPETLHGAHHRLHQFRISFYKGLQDEKATSVNFQEQCDDICETFRTASPPVGAAWEYRNAGNPENAPAQIDTIDDRLFGSVLCHCAEISLVVSERIIII
jgi:hypothetical protein